MGSFSIVQWLIVGLIAFGIYSVFRSAGSGKQMVCKACGVVGNGKSITRGNLLIEIVLWICFIVPGLIYSIWRHTTRYEGCRSCGKGELIPVDSPIGQRIIAENAKPPA